MARSATEASRRRLVATLRVAGKIAAATGMALAWLWALLALWFFDDVPGVVRGRDGTGVDSWFGRHSVSGARGVTSSPGGRCAGSRAALAASSDRPNQRDWDLNQDRTATAEFGEDGKVVIRNLRNSTYTAMAGPNRGGKRKNSIWIA